MARGRVHDGRRPQPLPEHPERGDVHDARPAAGRRPCDARRCRSSCTGRSSAACASSSRAAGRCRIDADENAETLRSACTKDDGATRLGELALVDGGGRIGPLQTVFFDTLLDENAASHIALGSGYAAGRRRRGRQAAHQREPDPRRLHDRQPRARRRRRHRRRRARAGAPKRRLADLSGKKERWKSGPLFLPAQICSCLLHASRDPEGARPRARPTERLPATPPGRANHSEPALRTRRATSPKDPPAGPPNPTGTGTPVTASRGDPPSRASRCRARRRERERRARSWDRSAPHRSAPSGRSAVACP